MGRLWVGQVVAAESQSFGNVGVALIVRSAPHARAGCTLGDVWHPTAPCAGLPPWARLEAGTGSGCGGSDAGSWGAPRLLLVDAAAGTIAAELQPTPGLSFRQQPAPAGAGIAPQAPTQQRAGTQQQLVAKAAWPPSRVPLATHGGLLVVGACEKRRTTMEGAGDGIQEASPGAQQLPSAQVLVPGAAIELLPATHAEASNRSGRLGWRAPPTGPSQLLVYDLGAAAAGLAPAASQPAGCTAASSIPSGTHATRPSSGGGGGGLDGGLACEHSPAVQTALQFVLAKVGAGQTTARQQRAKRVQAELQALALQLQAAETRAGQIPLLMGVTGGG